MNYFTISEHTTPDDLRRRYRTLCKRNHPDRGGSDETQAQINAEYQQALLQLAETEKQKGDESTADQYIRMAKRHIYNMYAEMKTPLIKKYVPEQYHGLAMEVAKLFEGALVG